MLAETGLLDGRSATLHWGFAEIFRQRYPRVSLKEDLMFIDQDRLYCSAGVSAGMDLSLYFVEKFCGRQIAVQSAKTCLFSERYSASLRVYGQENIGSASGDTLPHLALLRATTGEWNYLIRAEFRQVDFQIERGHDDHVMIFMEVQMTHQTVNVAEAKKRLSELLGRVAFGGEQIVITKRGKPMARLAPVNQESKHLAEAKGWLEEEDIFFSAIENIVSNREKHIPRIFEGRQEE